MTWVQTASGRRVSLVSPDPETICVEDIAHALGGICRYTGHTRRHYSVAEHSVRIASWLESEGQPPAVALAGLLHDAPEAYLGDPSYPLKVAMPDVVREWWDRRERAVARAIEVALGLPKGMVSDPPAIVHEADRRIVVDEREVFLGGTFEGWSGPAEGLKTPRHAWGFDRALASETWLAQYRSLRREIE